MKNINNRENKTIGIAALITVCLLLVMGATVVFAQSQIEKNSDHLGNGTDDELETYRSSLYKEFAWDQEIAKQVCEKYDLDYEKVTMGEITGEMTDYGIALGFLRDDGELPLLDQHTGYADCLEALLGDIYAFDGAGPIIRSICEEEGIDAEHALIKDLTVEQLMKMEAVCYETSDHPKN